MRTAGDFVAVDQLLGGCIQKQNLIADLFAVQLRQRIHQLLKRIAATQVAAQSARIHHQSHAVDAGWLLSVLAQVGKLWNQCRRNIVHTIDSYILQRVDRCGFSRAGHSCYDDKPHIPSRPLLFPKCYGSSLTSS